MYVGCSAVLLLLLTAGCCARVTPDTPASAPPVAATQPATPEPVVPPPAPAPSPLEPVSAPAPTTTPPTPQADAKPAAPAPPAEPAAAPAPSAKAPTPPAAARPPVPAPRAEPRAAPATGAKPSVPQQAGTTSTPPVAKVDVAAPPLDVNTLKESLKDTKAIGFFTKITLKNQMDDLLDRFRDYHQGKAKIATADLRRAYDLLVMKVLSLVQDADRTLASAILSSREAIWALLVDPKKFATLQG
jgi:hypothetical protein